jgi:hypothetical protein
VIFALTGLTCCSRKPDLAQIAKEGMLSLKYDGKDLPIKVEVMDVFLIDPEYENKYPETFALRGPDLEAVGKFPMEVRVGYDENFENMIYHTVYISETADPRGEGEKNSKVTLPGIGAIGVTGGTIVVQKVLGQNPSGAGKIISGRIRLDLASGGSAEGTFVFLAKTWG